MTGLLEVVSAFVWWLGLAAIALAVAAFVLAAWLGVRDRRDRQRQQQRALRGLRARYEDDDRRLARELDDCLDRILSGGRERSLRDRRRRS